ncbi:MAG: hypothetical protein M3133_02300, partial [Actinomycetota bacterium]|nr:hypothetical protein [Actinomycetota bacterium]
MLIGEILHGGLQGALDTAAVVVLAALGGACAIAATEMCARFVRDRRSGVSTQLSALYAQRLYARVLYGVAPAGVAAVIALVRTGELSSAAFLFAAMVLVAAILRARAYPLHLMPIARYAFNAFVPTMGVALAVIPDVLGPYLIEATVLLPALIGAVLTTVMSAVLEDRFQADRPIRLAVIGPSTFTAKLASELGETGIHGYRVVGYLDEESLAVDATVRCLGTLDDVRDAVQREALDLLVVAPQNPRLAVFDQAARACLDLPVRMIEATALYEDVLGHVPIGTINSAWFQFIMHPRYSPSSPLSKRVLDLMVSSLLLLTTLPLLV